MTRINLSATEAAALAVAALERLSFSRDEAEVIARHLVDAELCGYPALGLTRILTIAEHPRFREPRSAPKIVHETPISAMVDGGNTVGFYAVHWGAQIALEKARAQRIAVVGIHNSYLSGRNAHYVEAISRAGFLVIHTACSAPVVAPLGGRAPAFGTNPLALGFPGNPDPLVFDMSTAALNHGDVILAQRLGALLPEGMAIDARGSATRDPAAALAGCILPFGGHKGHGLALSMQALGLLAGAALPRGQVQDFAFVFLVVDPGLLMPAEQFKCRLAELLDHVRATPRQHEVDEIRIPSERAFRSRAQHLREGFTLPDAIYRRIRNL